MSNIERREYYIEDPLIPKLFIQSWHDKDSSSRGTVLITHGISEHSECYDHVAQSLAKAGWHVFAWDLQGHGRSQGKRGYIRDFKEFGRDLKTVIEKIKNDETVKSNPFVLLGHSMGGLIILWSLIHEKLPNINAVVLSNPALKIRAEVSKVKEVASLWLNNVWPTLTLNNDINYSHLSRDLEQVASYSKDPLRHTKVSAPLYLGMLETMKDVLSQPEKQKVPFFFQIGGHDQLIDPQTTLDFYKKLNAPKKLALYNDSYHEVYNDINRKETVDDLIAYLGELRS